MSHDAEVWVNLAWWLHAAVTWAMVGILWLVQVVVYPQLVDQPPDGFGRRHRDYTRRMGWVVGPIMMVEAITAVGWVARVSGSAPAWLGVALLAVCWLQTFRVQVPLHRRLEVAHDAGLARQLVRTNLGRTLAWTARGLLVVAVGAGFWQ